jgi:chromosome segregation ATPase
MELSHDRVQRRLLDHGKFQMKQTLVLQDDEIERLTTRLRLLRTRKLNIPTQFQLTHDRHRNTINTLTTTLRQIREQHISTLNTLLNKHRTRIAKITAEHSQNLSDFKRKSAKLSPSPVKRISFVEDDETFAELLQDINSRSQELLNQTEEKVTHTVEETDQTLERLKLQTRIARRRVADLVLQVEEMKSAIRKKKIKAEVKLSDIDARCRAAEVSAKASKSAYSFSVDDIEHAEVEPGDLLELREKVRNAQKDLAKKRERFEEKKKGFDQKLENLAMTKAKYQLSQAKRPPDTTRADLLARKRTEERRKIAEVRKKILELDPELKALRQENLNLLRKVNAQDYAIHGRKGLHQRFARMNTARLSPINLDD